MNLMGNEIMNVMHQCLQDYPCKTGSTAHKNPGKYKKLVPAEPVVQPVQNKLIAAGFFQSVILKISFKF